MIGLDKNLLKVTLLLRINFKYANISLYVKINYKAGGILLGKKIKKHRLYDDNICSSYSKYYNKYIFNNEIK